MVARAGASGSLFPWADFVYLSVVSAATLGVGGLGVGTRPFCWLIGRLKGLLKASDVGGLMVSVKIKKQRYWFVF